MISVGDFAVFVVAVIIVAAFFVVLRRIMRSAERDVDAPIDGHSKR